MDKGLVAVDDQNLIGSASSMKHVVTALTQRHCSDLTSSLDLASCSIHPVAGGGFCDVYRGVMTSSVKVAIKTMRVFERPGKDDDKEKLLKRTARELYHWSQLRHPNVMPLMGLAMFRGHVSMISEWMDNGNLASYIIANPSVNRMDICIDICAGLLYIHENNMVHGDLKAANIMISADGTAMITDFGNSKLRDLTLKFTGTTNASFSLRWAETFTGKVPFEEFSDHQVMIMVAVKRKTPARPRAEVNDQLWQLLQECWAWDQSARPEITAVAERLSGILSHSLADAGAFKDSSSNLEARSLEASHSNLSLPKVSGVISPKDRPWEGDAEFLRSTEPGAATHQTPSRLADAESRCLKLLSARKRLLKDKHPDTLESMEVLATIYRDLGRLAEAESLESEALAARKLASASGQVSTPRNAAGPPETCPKQHGLDRATSLIADLSLQPMGPKLGARTCNDVAPPQWLADCVLDVERYSDNRVSIIAKPMSGHNSNPPPEFGLRCLDCPGKLYDPGPGTSLGNFEIHLRKRTHKANVWRRLAVYLDKPLASLVRKVESSTPALGD